MSDRGNLLQGEESHLIVGVVEEARNGEHEPKPLSRVTCCPCMGPGSCEFRGSLDEHGGRKNHEATQDGEDGKHVTRCEVFP